MDLSRPALLLAACVLSLLAAELAVKLVFFGWHSSPAALFAPSPDPERIYELRPGVRITSTYLNPEVTDWEYTVSINEHGFRGEFDPASRRPRVIVLGDSYAFGLGVSDGESFPSQLAKSLGDAAQVLNWGVPAYNLAQQVALFEARREAYPPVIVVLAFHPNDFEPPVFADAAQVRWSRRSHLYSLWLHARWMLGDDLEARLARDREARVEGATEAFDRLVESSHEHGFELLLFEASCWRGRDEAAVTPFFRHAKQLGVATVDADARFCRALERRSIPGDGHPTRAGHALLARRLEDELEPRLRARAGQ